jgi:excisionase family DNA binding protein
MSGSNPMSVEGREGFVRPGRCPICGCPRGVELLRVAVVARALDVSPMTVRRMCASGELRSLKISKTWRISHYGEGGLHEYLQQVPDD